MFAGLRQFFGRYDRRTPKLDLSWGPELEHRADGVFLAVVQNLSPFTYFGRRPLRLSPQADLDRGLDVFAMDSFRTRHVVPVLLSAFGRARHSDRAHVISVRDQSRIAIRCAEPMPAQADGEFLGEVTVADIESVPGALRVLS